MPHSQTLWHFQVAVALPGLRMVCADLESYISVNQHLEMMIQEDWSLLSSPEHGGAPQGPASSPGQRLRGTRRLTLTGPGD